MNVAMLFSALGVALVLWFFTIRRLRTKPWLEKGSMEIEAGLAEIPPQRIGLWVFLGVVTSLFSLFMIMYVERSGFPDWRPVNDPQLLWINTAFLVLGSLAFQMARNAARHDSLAGVKLNLTAGGVFTIVFIVGQIIAWRQLTAGGTLFASNPANTFFYLVTGLHALHLLGGLWVWARTTWRVWQGLGSLEVADIAKIRLSVQLCAVYWHFLLLLWLVLFYLLITT
ncbi:MAG TPA: cytochrome-c oxidase [Gammaproteobacteria bacterium]